MFTLKINNQTARRLSYLMGHSDEANAMMSASMNAARMAEQQVRDAITLIADQAGEKLPENYTVEFHEEENHIRIIEKPEEANRVNGVNHE